MIDPRAQRAASYWTSRPGHHHLAVVVDHDDAQQEAALALLEDPNAQQVVLYRRVLDAVRKLVPGDRQKSVPLHVPAEDYNVATPCRAADQTLTAERVSILQRLPEQDRRIVECWIDGLDDRAAARQYGVAHWTWRKHRQRLFTRLQERGL